MPLPEFERIIFNKAPLSLAIGQVRFPILLRFGEAGFLAPFQEAIRDVYPKASREHHIGLELSEKGFQPSPSQILWRFSTPDNAWAVVVGEGAVTLESRGYSSIDDFLCRIGRVLEAAHESLKITERTRLGFRYINEIRHANARTVADWGKLLNPEFLGFSTSGLLDGDVDQMHTTMQVRRSDGVLAIRHGLLNGTVIRPQPEDQEPTGPFYLIDLDYYDTSECKLDIPTTINQMRGYNDFIYRFFRWTIGDTLFKELEPSHAG